MNFLKNLSVKKYLKKLLKSITFVSFHFFLSNFAEKITHSIHNMAYYAYGLKKKKNSYGTLFSKEIKIDFSI